MANRAIATPIKGVVPHPGATLPYSEFNGFNKLPAPVRLGLGPDLELPSTVCVAINHILYSLRSVDFVYDSALNKCIRYDSPFNISFNISINDLIVNPL